MTELNGSCLCGAVNFSVSPAEHVDVCHCASCRQWGAGPFVGIEAKAVTFSSQDTLRWYQSSDWASRGFCQICGSSLFYKLADEAGGVWSISAGTIANLPDNMSLTKEIFIDSKPDYYTFEGERTRLTGEQVFAAATGDGDIE
jgi:hypothetical protein